MPKTLPIRKVIGVLGAVAAGIALSRFTGGDWIGGTVFGVAVARPCGWCFLNPARPGGTGRYFAAMCAAVHGARPVVSSVAPTLDLGLPGRRSLESALREVNQPWSSGPFAERARDALARHADDVAELLSLADRLSIDVAGDSSNWVVTHGEPHAANVMRATGTRLLIDWDTVAIGPPERDLWMLVDGTGEVAAAYF